MYFTKDVWIRGSRGKKMRVVQHAGNRYFPSTRYPLARPSGTVQSKTGPWLMHELPFNQAKLQQLDVQQFLELH